MNSNLTLTKPQLDHINCPGFTDQKDLFKQAVQEVSGSSEWEPCRPISGYSQSESEKVTGSKLDWNSYNRNSEHWLNGRMLGQVNGSYLKTLSLVEQVRLLTRLRKWFKISRLDLKIQVNGSPRTINQINDLVKYTTKGKARKISYKPYRSHEFIESGDKDSNTLSPTLYFPNRKGHKRAMCIYDPLVKHGIANAQHWELRLHDEHVERVLIELLAVCNSEERIGITIKEMVFEGIDFRDERGRASWYQALKDAPLVA